MGESISTSIKINNENIFRYKKSIFISWWSRKSTLQKFASILVNRGHEITIITFDSIGSNSFYFLDPKIRRIDLSVGDSSSRAKLFESFLRLRALKKLLIERNLPL